MRWGEQERDAQWGARVAELEREAQDLGARLEAAVDERQRLENMLQVTARHYTYAWRSCRNPSPVPC
jgi:hypothetical protein